MDFEGGVQKHFCQYLILFPA